MRAQWDDALISRAQAIALAGAEQVAWHRADGGGLVLRHAGCGQSCGLWVPGQPTSVDDILSGVLRHLVMAHDLPLNRAERDRRARERAAGTPGHDGGGGGPGESGAGAPAGADPGAGAGGGADAAPGDGPGAGRDGGADQGPGAGAGGGTEGER